MVYLDYGSADEHGEIAALIAGATGSPLWQLVETPAPYDIAVFRRGRLDTHVGIVVAPGLMLHMVDEDCAKIERYDGGAWRHRLTGHWRHASAATAEHAMVPVLATPLLDPGAARIEMELPHGMSIADMVKAALPGMHDLAQVRVTLVTERGAMQVSQSVWDRVKPRPGVRVVIRVIPGKSAMRTILAIAVTVAAVAMAAYFAGPLAGLLGISVPTAQGLISAGVTALGNLAINALIPPNAPDKAKPNFSISGWRNRLDPDGPVPVVLGSVRTAPPFAAMSWTEIVGDWQYVRAMLCVGVGPVDITDLQIGETSIAEFDEVDLEIREGRAGDAPISLYPRQILEEPVGTELTRPMPRDDAGNIIDDNASIETPVVRTTAADTETASIILGWPAGLVFVNDEGDRRSEEVRSDSTISAVQIYRSSRALNRATDCAGEPVNVQPARRYTSVLGDGTRTNLLANADMASATVWSFGAGWSVSAGAALHAAGNATALLQAVAGLKVGVTYRIAYTASVSAGTVRAQITGGSTRSGAVRSSGGRFTDRLQAVTGNNAFRFIADAAFAGSVDDVLLYAETASCLDPGTHNIWLEAVNRDGLPGPVSGPFTVTVE